MSNDMKHKYTVITVNSLVYVSSSYHHFFSVVIKKHGKGFGEHAKTLHYDYCPDDGWFTSEHYPTITMPKYVRLEVLRLIADGIKAKRFRYHEYDRDGNKRFENLRYHDDDWEARALHYIEHGKA